MVFLVERGNGRIVTRMLLFYDALPPGPLGDSRTRSVPRRFCLQDLSLTTSRSALFSDTDEGATPTVAVRAFEVSHD